MRKFASFLEYGLSLLFIGASVNVVFRDPSILPGLFTVLVGQVAIYVYGVIFLILGLSLLYAKLYKNKTWHKNALLSMYLTCVYFFLLSAAVHGASLGLILVVVAGMLSGALWLRWKFMTEYVDLKEFRKDSNLRQ